jgi:hypothetical protein
MTGAKCRNFERRHAVIAIDDAKERIASVHHKWQGNPKDNGIDTKVVQRVPSCSLRQRMLPPWLRQMTLPT